MHIIRILLLALGLAGSLSACNTTAGDAISTLSGSNRGVTAVAMKTPMPVPACRVGERFSLEGINGLFRFDVLTPNRNARALEHLDNRTPAGDYLMPLYRDVKDGHVPRYDGADAEIVFTILGVNAAGAPDEVPYLTGTAPNQPPGIRDGICRGYAKVERVSSNEIRVRLPLRGGEHLGQVSFVLPRAILEGFPQVLACATWSIDVEAPKLDIGPRSGWKNTSCGLPGNWPGYTRVGEAIKNGGKWILFGAVPQQNHQTPKPIVLPPPSGSKYTS